MDDGKDSSETKRKTKRMVKKIFMKEGLNSTKRRREKEGRRRTIGNKRR